MIWLFCGKAIVIPLLLATVILPASGNDESDDENTVHRSVVSVQDYIGLDRRSWHRRWEHICEGVIVTRSIVLTACRCMMDNKNPPKLKKPACNTRVEAGNANLNTYNNFREVRRVEEFLPHPKCGLKVLPDHGQWHHDVGLMVLKYDLVFNPEIKPAKLLNKKLFRADQQQAMETLNDLQEEGARCSSSGWLIESADHYQNHDPEGEGLRQPRKRHAVKMHLLYPESCKKRLCSSSKDFCAHFDEYDPLCAFRLGSVCSEVSGGPLFCDGSFYGTVSNRTGCGTETPLVFTSLKPILELIDQYKPKYGHGEFRRKPGFTVCKGGEKYVQTEEDEKTRSVNPFDKLKEKAREKAKSLEKEQKTTKQGEKTKPTMTPFDELRKKIHEKAESLKKRTVE